MDAVEMLDKKPRIGNRERKVIQRNRVKGYLFISPWVLGFLIFSLYPIVISLYYSFCDYNILKPPKWVGLSNYVNLFTNDPMFYKSLWNTLYYSVFSLPLCLIVSLALALLLNAKIRALSFYRTIYYLPTIMPAVASSILWMWLLDPSVGLVNSFLSSIGIKGPKWLVDPMWAKPALIIMSVWTVGQTIVIYLAGLQDVPEELYEAANLDGAGTWQKFLHVTMPLITPTIFFNLIMGLINSFQFFTQAYVMTAGGPMDSTRFYSLYLFDNAFKYYHMGYASTQAWIMFVIIMGVTIFVFNSSKKWVYYGSNS